MKSLSDADEGVPMAEPPPEDEVVKVRTMLNAQKTSPKENPKYSDEEIMEANELRLMKLGRRGGCRNRRGGKGLKCNCLGILENPVYRSMVGSYTLAMFKKKKEDRDQSIIEWIKYKRAAEKNKTGNKGSSKDKHFLLPYDRETKINWDDVDDSTVLDLSPVQNARLCTSALLDVIEIGAKKYQRLDRIASKSFIPRPH
mmetsp:Transcript_27312/g.56944  ORF Transcript_27312/g.56944 Transcript_27312/m.56944 type:complete len:199 (+) Transcript_27312:429-1025(+)